MKTIGLRLLGFWIALLVCGSVPETPLLAQRGETVPPGNPATVRIAAGQPVPQTVYVALGSEVGWINVDDRAHLVKAAGDGFPPFSLAAQGRHAVRFSKVGRYPYTVDGDRDGVVIVVAGAGSQGGTPPPRSDTAGTFTYYEWEGTIKKQWTRNFDVEPNKVTSKWTGEFRVRFAQVPSTTSGNYGFPLELDYSIVGNAVYADRHRPESEVTVSGTASGQLRGGTLVKPNLGRANEMPKTDLDDEPLGRARRIVRLPALKGMFPTIASRLDAEILHLGAAHPVDPSEGAGRPLPETNECEYAGQLPGSYRIRIVLRGPFTHDEDLPLFDGIRVTSNRPGDTKEDRYTFFFNHIDLQGADVCGRIFTSGARRNRYRMNTNNAG